MARNDLEIGASKLRDALEIITAQPGPWQDKRDAVAAWMSDNAGSEWAEFMSWFGAEVDE